MLLLGEEKLSKLESCHVVVAGLGGVGGFAAEMLVRSGIGKLTIIDADKYQSSNINRQIGALNSTVGKEKTLVTSDRLLDINPELKLEIITEYLEKSRIERIFVSGIFDYVVDAIDTLLPKFTLICHCLKNNIKIVSSMGAGAKLDVSQVKITDISNSYSCRLAYNIRKKLHREGIFSGYNVVFSPEPVYNNSVVHADNEPNKRSVAGTISYMPATFGIYCAAEVIRNLISEE